VAVRVVAAAAEGLHYAHTLTGPDGTPQGVVHRDISPDNIMVARDGSVKVLDFGVAKLRGSEGTQSGEIKGKIPFMSPEQLDPDSEIDGRSDLWSLGITLYWAIAGRRPFAAQSDVLTIRQILEKDPEPLKNVNRAVDAALSDVVMNLLDKKRDQRVPTGAKLSAKLLKLVPASQGNPLSKFMERMALFDDDPPENRFKSPSSIAGVPGAPMSRDSTDIIRPDATSFAEMMQQTSAEDVPSTVRLEREQALRMRRSRTTLYAIAGALGVVVVVGIALALTRKEQEPEPQAKVVVIVDAGVKEEPTDEIVDAGLDEPDVVDAGAAGRKKTTYRTVQVSAPPNIKWTTAAGKPLGAGTRAVQLPDYEQTIVAVDAKMDARISFPVAAKVDFAKAPKGTLLIRVLPYATNVKIGAMTLGQTPLKPVQLTAGVYRVVIEKDGKTTTKLVKVKPQKDGDSLLAVDLRK
jgi:eukaryotic-like serine/threonine-protein kinase